MRAAALSCATLSCAVLCCKAPTRRTNCCNLLLNTIDCLLQLIGEAARDTRLLHASVAYGIVAGRYGGLTVDELRQVRQSLRAEWSGCSASNAMPPMAAAASVPLLSQHSCLPVAALLASSCAAQCRRQRWTNPLHAHPLQLEGEELPTVFAPHTLLVEADPDVRSSSSSSAVQLAIQLLPNVLCCNAHGGHLSQPAATWQPCLTAAAAAAAILTRRSSNTCQASPTVCRTQRAWRCCPSMATSRR